MSNLDLATNLIFKATTNSEANQWEAGLTWLQQIYEPSPPSFRQSLLLNLKHKSLDAVVDTFRDLITATVEASKPPSSSKDKSNRHFKSDPFWLLTTIFEQLILSPRPPKHELPPGSESTTQCIYRRLRWFRAGRISELYEESRKVKSKPPSSLRSSSNDSSYREKNAQLAADQDNFGTCNARLTKDTPVALVNDDNIGALYDLHPPEVYPPSVAPLRPRRRKTRKSRFSNKRRITFTADTIVKNILHLKKGKAPGIQVDSIDLFIYLAQRCKQPNAKHGLKPFASTLASFFTTAANGEIPEKLVNIFRTTYLVALEKDPIDKTKLRPLGIPTAIRRITANAIANELKSTFATYLLPYNYAVGIHGGIDFITSTIRIGVEKYISNLTDAGLLPSRALVSLDIRNMFNAISRHKLREIVREEFPSLEAFVDCLYEDQGSTVVKMEDGSWETIPVTEGFSQGCPLSPILAAIVLNYILKQVDERLSKHAKRRARSSSDDGLGCLAIIMAYVDDANFLVHLDDVKPLLEAFKEIAEPLGAIMNTEKTRILTSTSGKSILEDLASFNKSTHDSLKSAIQTFSKNKDGSMHEEVNGLRILGVPIGNDTFCENFHLSRVEAALSDSKKILQGLNDKQTMLRVFKTCTVHKLTHLFASDVASSPTSSLPPQWNLWSSNLCNKFSSMLNEFLQELMGVHSIPAHSHILSTLSLSNGGLGLQHPRLAAIPSFMLTIKRAINFAIKGVHLPFTPSAIQLPASLTNLYSNWDSECSTCRTFQAFQLYLPSITATIINDDPTATDSLSRADFDKFLHRTSFPWARETLRHHASEQYLIHLLESSPDDVLHTIPGMLLQHMSLPLVSMSRSNIKNRLDNKSFDIALKSKLRIPIYNESSRPLCFCGTRIDCHADHYFSCGEYKKTRCSNKFRDTTKFVMKRICPTAQYCNSANNVERELTNRVKETASKRPFDWSFVINHIKAAELKGTSPLSEIGFDVTVISPSTPDNLQENACPFNNSISLLEEGERKKFAREGADTDKSTGITLSGDQFIGKLYDSNKGFIPQSMDRWGNMGPLFKRFLVGDREAPVPQNYPTSRPYARKMNERACSYDVPYGILNTANKCWQQSHPDVWYGDSYMDSNPKSWALQQLGLGFTKAITEHIVTCDEKIQDPTSTSIYKSRRRNKRVCVVPLETETTTNAQIDTRSGRHNGLPSLTTSPSSLLDAMFSDASSQNDPSTTIHTALSASEDSQSVFPGLLT